MIDIYRIPALYPELESIVTLLDDEHRDRIQGLWNEIEHRFGIKSPYLAPLPHFSYQVADTYPRKELESVLSELTSAHFAFTVRAAGLGVFTGEEPVLYLPLVRNRELSRFHRELWNCLENTAVDLNELYHPDSWMPHITLVQGRKYLSCLPQLVTMLAGCDLDWEIEVTNVSLIRTGSDAAAPDARFELNT